MKSYRLKNRKHVTRRHVVRIFDWCKDNLGESEYFCNETIRIRISSGLKRFMGEFNIERNCIYVNPKRNEDELDLIATIIHEYTHFQQDYNEYERIDMLLPRRRRYFDHPLEKEAEDRAQKLKADCFREIRKDLNW